MLQKKIDIFMKRYKFQDTNFNDVYNAVTLTAEKESFVHPIMVEPQLFSPGFAYYFHKFGRGVPSTLREKVIIPHEYHKESPKSLLIGIIISEDVSYSERTRRAASVLLKDYSSDPSDINRNSITQFVFKHKYSSNGKIRKTKVSAT